MRNIKADQLIPLPDTISFQTAAAVLFKGFTARYLLRDTFPVGPGHVVLYHAAAGGLGLIFCQWAAALGATVIGTVGADAKIPLALAHGCHHVINYRTQDFAKRVREITDGRGVDVVDDAVGKDTFEGSLDCLKTRGLWVSFGRASGAPPAVDMATLAAKGSLYATRPTLFHHIATQQQRQIAAADLFDALQSGAVSVVMNTTYPLQDAASAHADMEARVTTGASVLIP